jgi:hypothetical protein
VTIEFDFASVPELDDGTIYGKRLGRRIKKNTWFEVDLPTNRLILGGPSQSTSANTCIKQAGMIPDVGTGFEMSKHNSFPD